MGIFFPGREINNVNDYIIHEQKVFLISSFLG